MKNDNKIAFYYENENGLYDELVLDFYSREYKLNTGLDEKALWLNESKRNKEFLVDAELFDCLCRAVIDIYDGEYFDKPTYDEIIKTYKKNPAKITLLNSEEIKRAINWEISEEEMHEYILYDKYKYQKGSYYDFDLIIDKIHAFMRGEKSVSYFTAWCVLLMRCLNGAMEERSRKIKALYADVADFFDGLAFMGGAEIIKSCKEAIARLKYYNHRLENLKNNTDGEFTKNGAATYVSFRNSLNDGEDCLYNVCIVDFERETANYMIVPEFIYDEQINYTFLSPAGFDDLSSEYCDFKLDVSMGIDYQLKKQL